MDDGTAGEVVASSKYWKAMSASTLDGNSEGPSTPRAPVPEVISEEQEAGAQGHGGGGGGSSRRASGGTPSTLGGAEWVSIHLDSGNVKVEASATAAEVTFMACM